MCSLIKPTFLLDLTDPQVRIKASFVNIIFLLRNIRGEHKHDVIVQECSVNRVREGGITQLATDAGVCAVISNIH